MVSVRDPVVIFCDLLGARILLGRVGGSNSSSWRIVLSESS